MSHTGSALSPTAARATAWMREGRPPSHNRLRQCASARGVPERAGGDRYDRDRIRSARVALWYSIWGKVHT